MWLNGIDVNVPVVDVLKILGWAEEFLAAGEEYLKARS